MPRLTIDNEIVFSPEEKKLLSLRNGKSIIIFSTGARCLEYLIEKQGITVSPKELIPVGWVEEDAYKTVSQATYYQCLTDLRRNFKDLGYNVQLIKTVRGQGVRIDTDTSITLTTDDDPVTHSEPLPPQSIPPAILPQGKKKGHLFIMAAISTIVFMAVIYIIISNLKQKDSIEGDYHSVKGYPECYLFNKENTNNELVVQFLQKKNFTCEKSRKYYISHFSAAPRLTIFSCSATKPTTCESFTFLDNLS